MPSFKGLNENVIRQLSATKKEPEWMFLQRLKAYSQFVEKDNPHFGPDLSSIDFQKYFYYKKAGTLSTDWEDVPTSIRKTFDDLGVIEAEKKYFGGVATQMESEMIYHNMLKEVADKGVIFVDADTALREHEELFKQYFGKLVPATDNKYAALNSAVWSGGSFIYIPKGVKLEKPLQSYFRINSEKLGQFERTIIIVDEGAEVVYIEGCTALVGAEDMLHASVVEIYVKKNAKCRYMTIQNWSLQVLNLVTKRAIVEENGLMEWIDGNIGSLLNMKYPCSILKGDNSHASCISIALARETQIHDSGAKMIHLGKNSGSRIIAKSVVDCGVADYRGLVQIAAQAEGAKSFIECDTLFLSSRGSSCAYPVIDNHCNKAIIEHEARVSRISEEQLFYLLSRGLNEKEATNLLVLGFMEPFSKELPLEYAVELNQLIRNYL